MVHLLSVNNTIKPFFLIEMKENEAYELLKKSRNVTFAINQNLS